MLLGMVAGRQLLAVGQTCLGKLWVHGAGPSIFLLPPVRSRLCLQVMGDPMVSKQERKARAQGLRQLGRIFLEVGTAATQGPATRVRNQPAATVTMASMVLHGSHASALGPAS